MPIVSSIYCPFSSVTSDECGIIYFFEIFYASVHQKLLKTLGVDTIGLYKRIDIHNKRWKSSLKSIGVNSPRDWSIGVSNFRSKLQRFREINLSSVEDVSLSNNDCVIPPKIDVGYVQPLGFGLGMEWWHLLKAFGLELGYRTWGVVYLVFIRKILFGKGQ